MNNYLHELKIGNVTLKNNILLAPMAGITNLPFRRICENFKPGLVYTEMVSSKGLFYNDGKTNQLLNMENETRPVAVQIFGNDIEAMKEATKQVSKIADIIDINMGCPAPKIVKNGDGCKLMQKLELARDIIKTVVENANKVETKNAEFAYSLANSIKDNLDKTLRQNFETEVTKIPVTVKMRKGWDRENITAIELAKIAEEAGASAVTIHGRTREDFYSGDVDLQIIKKVKEAVSIPVIGNGDIKSKEDAKKMLEETGVDGIMIGRGSIRKSMDF